MQTMPRPRPPHLHREKSRHGKWTWVVRFGKGPRTRIHAEYGTDAFDQAYRDAISGKNVAPRQMTKSGTLRWLWERYRESTAWAELSAATRRQRENIMLGVLKTSGDEHFVRITR